MPSAALTQNRVIMSEIYQKILQQSDVELVVTCNLVTCTWSGLLCDPEQFHIFPRLDYISI